jgi:cytochrome P450
MGLIHFLGPGEIILTLGLWIYLVFHLMPVLPAATILIGTFTALYLYLDNCNSYWKKQGIPSPKGNIFYGNLIQLFKDLIHFDQKFFKELNTNAIGSILMGVPDYVTTDLDFIKQVLIKEFDAFPDRFDFTRSTQAPESLRANFLTIKEGDEWRKVRQRCTPAFTSGKMKKLLPPMNYCAKELCDFLEPFAADGKDVPLKDVFSKLTMNVIGRCVFASDFNSLQSDNDVPLLKFSKKIFEVKLMSPSIMVMLTFPNFCKLYQQLTHRAVIQHDVDEFFIKTLTEVMQQRLNDPEAKDKYNDAVQLLLNAMEEKEFKIGKEDADIISETVEKTAKQPLTKMEILAQLLIFLAAGYETTATTLHFISYILALKPDVQEKVRDEVNEIFGDKDEIGYEDITKFQYMNAVINETLRILPPATRLNRLCQKDITIQGVKFEKGSTFSVPIYAIHHDPEIYENPEEFIPERFLPDESASRHPMAFLPFGAGPRNCLGMRFAEYELRVTLAWIIKRFRFVASDESPPEWPIKLDSSAGLLKTKNPLKCKIVKI